MTRLRASDLSFMVPANQGAAPAKRGHKYGAKATTVDGHRFPSKAEARRYQELRLLERAGHIESLELQPSFVLNAPLTTGTIWGAMKASAGNLPKIGTYRADFKYFDLTGKGWVVEDVKGVTTPLYAWKKRHVEAQYGITVVEIRRTR